MVSSDDPFWIGTHDGHTVVAALHIAADGVNQLQVHVQDGQNAWRGTLCTTLTDENETQGDGCAAVRKKSASTAAFELISAEKSAFARVTVLRNPARLRVAAGWATELKVVGVYLQVVELRLEHITTEDFFRVLLNRVTQRNEQVKKLEKQSHKLREEANELEATAAITCDLQRKRQSKMATAMALKLNDWKAQCKKARTSI